MKAKTLTLICLAALLALPVFAQQSQPPTRQPGQPDARQQEPAKKQDPATKSDTQGTDAQTQGTQAGAARKNIVETATDTGNFTTFAKAVEAAGLTETLNSGDYTVFAPTDEAFAKLPAGTLDSLMADKEKLKKVLLNHVVSGKVMASDVGKMKSAKTAGGSAAEIKSADGKVMVGKATVVQTDIAASNGVIHAIDTVLMP
jgi:uncharacterized surface protein with fasciclin (FAS1) repeats